MMNDRPNSVEELVMDSDFRAWVTGSDEDAAGRWQTWMMQNPAVMPMVQEARRMVMQLQFRTEQPSVSEMEAVRRRIEMTIGAINELGSNETLLNEPRLNEVILNEKELNDGMLKETGSQVVGLNKTERDAKIMPVHRYRWAMVAAAAVLILTVGGLYWIKGMKQVETTGFAATKEVVLPDGSKVLMNANSRLSYSKGWDAGHAREVWIKGEAYFIVSRKPVGEGESSKFVVHTGGVDVMVLGTTFNVYNRRERVDVVLETGKIAARATSSEKTDMVSLKPGQLMNLTGSQMKVRQVDPAQYIAWKDQRLMFDNQSLSEIAQLLEDNYGYRVTWKQERLKDLRFTGSCPTTNVGLLLSAIGAVYDLKIKREGNTVSFDSK